MTSTATIRVARAGDERVLAGLNANVHALHVEKHPQHFKPASLDQVTDWFRGLLVKPSVRIWIAEAEGTAVGYASAFWHERPETPFGSARRWIEIDQIGVQPDYQRRGIARQLVEQIVAAATQEGASGVELGSWSFNEGAHKAFGRLGFAPQRLRFWREVSGTGRPAFAKLSPFAAVRWVSKTPEVEIDGRFYGWLAIDGVAIDVLVEFAIRTYNGNWKKRISEDLVEVMTAWGQPPGRAVTLDLVDPQSGARLVREGVPMTEENRRHVWRANRT